MKQLIKIPPLPKHEPNPPGTTVWAACVDNVPLHLFQTLAKAKKWCAYREGVARYFGVRLGIAEMRIN